MGLQECRPPCLVREERAPDRSSDGWESSSCGGVFPMATWPPALADSKPLMTPLWLLVLGHVRWPWECARDWALLRKWD